MRRLASTLVALLAAVVWAAACGRTGADAPSTTSPGIPSPFGTLPLPPPGPPFCQPTDATLAGCYEMNGDTHDGSSGAFDATATIVSFASGHRGEALVVGTSSTVTVPANPRFNGAPGLTVELWVKPAELPPAGQRRGLLDKDQQFGVFLRPGSNVSCAAAGTTITTVGGEIRLGVWNHVACTYDGGRVRLFVDGSAAISSPATGAIAAGAAIMSIGEDSPSGADQLLGEIDDLRLFTRALSTAEISDDARP